MMVVVFSKKILKKMLVIVDEVLINMLDNNVYAINHIFIIMYYKFGSPEGIN